MPGFKFIPDRHPGRKGEEYCVVFLSSIDGDVSGCRGLPKEWLRIM